MNARNLTLALVAAAAIAGCDRDTVAQAERKTDSAVQRSRAELAEAGAKTKETLAQAGDKLGPKLDAAGDRIAEAGSKVAATVKETVKIDRDNVTATGGPGAPVKTTIRTGPESSVSGLPEKTREALEDTAILTAIKAGFVKEPGLSALKIDVDSRDGVVTLNGVADSDDARRRAEQVASSTRGVKEVRNHLTVKQG